MHKTIVAFAVAIMAAAATASESAASDKTDIVATMHQFVDSLNKGDTKTAVAACASPASIIDEFPPHEWQGPTACADWAKDFEAYNTKSGVTEPIARVGTPKHVDITGDRAYVVAPATYTYKQKGKRVTESHSILTVALQKGAVGSPGTELEFAL